MAKKGVCHNKNDGVPVVLGGGASRGPGHSGLLDALDDARVLISMYIGISIGSIVGAFRTNNRTTEQIDDVFVSGLQKMWSVGGVLRALVPPVFQPLRLFGGGVLDLVPIMSDLVDEYGLTTQDNLYIVAYDLISRQVVVFSGHDYNLKLALAASCAVPGMMRPVEVYYKGRRMLLVDGGVFHPHPGSLCAKPAIIGKLIDTVGLNLVYTDREEDVICSVGKPFAPFFTSLSREKVTELHEYGYTQARDALAVPLRRGLLPIAA